MGNGAEDASRPQADRCPGIRRRAVIRFAPGAALPFTLRNRKIAAAPLFNPQDGKLLHETAAPPFSLSARSGSITAGRGAGPTRSARPGRRPRTIDVEAGNARYALKPALLG
jgi:hypothetical protein